MSARKPALWIGLFVLTLAGPAIATDLPLPGCRVPGVDRRLPGLPARGQQRSVVFERRHRLRAEGRRMHTPLSG